MGKSRIGKRRARATRPASFLPNSAKTQFRKKTYGEPGALFSVNRLSDAEAQIGSLASVSSAERWSGNPEPTNMRLPNEGGHWKPVYMHDLYLWASPFKWFSGSHGFMTLSRDSVR